MNGHTSHQNGNTPHQNGNTSHQNKLSNEVVDRLAVSPCDINRAAELAQQISSKSCSIPHASIEERKALLKVARSLVRALETPIESIGRSCWVEPTLYTAINTVYQAGVFSLMAANDPGTTSTEELAKATGAEEIVLSRLMKHLGSMEVLLEVEPDVYKLNNYSRALTKPKYADGFPCIANSAAPALYKLPHYLAQRGFTNPTDATDSAFTFATGTSGTWFSWIEANPEVSVQFNNHMTAYHEGRANWMDFYPVKQELIAGMRSGGECVLLVDVGGGLGQDVLRFHEKFPNAPGRLIVEDLPNVVSMIKEIGQAVEPIAHDFFNPQPIRGARAYYLHSVLHNWPNQSCVRILKSIAAAMEPGYSKLLISEPVVPDKNPDSQMTGLDIMMMTLYSAQERKESEWHTLVGEAGLKVTKIWSHPDGFESLIECDV